MSDKQKRISDIGDSGPYHYRTNYQDYDAADGWICLDGCYSSQQLRQFADVMDERPAPTLTEATDVVGLRAALAAQDRTAEDDLRDYGVAVTDHGLRIDPSSVVIHAPLPFPPAQAAQVERLRSALASIIAECEQGLLTPADTRKLIADTARTALLQPVAQVQFPNGTFDGPLPDAAESVAQGEVSELFNTFRLAYYGANKSLAPELESFRRAYAAIATQPHSPDAADSGRVRDDKKFPMTEQQVRQWIDACNHEPARQVLRDYLQLRAALAAQGQGEAADPLADDSPLQSRRAFVESWRLESTGSNGHDVIANRNTVRRLVHIIDHLAAQPRAVPDASLAAKLNAWADELEKWVADSIADDGPEGSPIMGADNVARRIRSLLASRAGSAPCEVTTSFLRSVELLLESAKQSKSNANACFVDYRDIGALRGELAQVRAMLAAPSPGESA